MSSSVREQLFSAERMMRKEEVLAPLPSTSEVYRITLNIVWPSAVESVLVSLISSIDTAMVGGLGPVAIAAVGITTQPRMIFLALIMSLNAGVTTVVARRKGENNREGANRCLKQTVLLSGLISIVAAILAWFLAAPLMHFAGAGTDILQDAVEYFRIIMVGFVFNSIGLTINAAQRGVGNTKSTMRTNIVANLVNLVLNYLLIGGNLGFPRLETRGAALATIIGQLVALVISLYSVMGRHAVFLNFGMVKSWRFDRDTMGSVFKISASAAVEQLFMRIGFFTYSRVVAGLGTLAFAAHQICSQVSNLSFSFGDGFNVAATSLVGQSLGAKRPDMAKLYVKVTKRMMNVIAAILALSFFLGRFFIPSIFTDDQAIILEASHVLMVISVITIAQTTNLIYSGCLRGAGDAKYVAMVAFVSIGIIRPIAAWLFCYPMGGGLVGAWCSMLLDQMIRCIFTYARFRSNKWTKIRV